MANRNAVAQRSTKRPSPSKSGDLQSKIRTVAIVVASVDAAAKQRLLNELSPSQARLVRQEIARLGLVSDLEKDAALKDFHRSTEKDAANDDAPSLRDEKANRNRPRPQTLARQQTSADSFDDRYDDSDNPALAIAQFANTSPDSFTRQNAGFDRLDISSRSENYADRREHELRRTASESLQDRFVNIESTLEDAARDRTVLEGLSAANGEELAKLLENERPTIIASVLRQASPKLGAALLASLPQEAAVESLTLLPTLDATDPELLQEIQTSLEQKLNRLRRSVSPTSPGVQMILDLLDHIPTSSRNGIESKLKSDHHYLAASLGIKDVVTELTPSVQRFGQPVVSPLFGDLVHPPAQSVNVQGAGLNNDHLRDSTTRTSEPSAPITAVEGAIRRVSFEELTDWPNADLASLIASIDPTTILMAAAGGAIAFRLKLESMISKRDVSRLRKRTDDLATTRAGDRVAARERIAVAAEAWLRERNP